MNMNWKIIVGGVIVVLFLGTIFHGLATEYGFKNILIVLGAVTVFSGGIMLLLSGLNE
jgi:formate hydrogenlyase subunit 3/multisubunit Na+/H+ antiporter MnhD subunit